MKLQSRLQRHDDMNYYQMFHNHTKLPQADIPPKEDKCKVAPVPKHDAMKMCRGHGSKAQHILGGE
jgi:hypothetical protein